MKKTFILFVSLFIVLGLLGGAGVSAQVLSNEKVIILFKDKVDKNLIAQAKGKINREFKNIPAIAVTAPSQAIKVIEKNPKVLKVEKNQILTIKQTQDWGIQRTQTPSAWNSNITGKGVKIAVVDTGIADHEDLFISGGVSFVSYTTSYSDDNGHGTHVGGIIGAKNNSIGTVGIAYDSSIYAVKALDKDGSGYLSDIVAGIDWSITNNMDIINLSLGSTTSSTTLKSAVDKAYNQGILVVAAAGNNGTADGSGDTVNYPARYDSVIAVAASDKYDNRATFSATGSTIEVTAPGVNILSTYPGSRYVQLSGTSMAAPYAAGNLALLKEANPTLSHIELREKLQTGSIDFGETGKDPLFGFGFIQAKAALQEEATTAPSTETDAVLQTKTLIETTKQIYSRGEQVAITVLVKDQDGQPLSGAVVSLSIIPPKGNVLVGEGTTKDGGKVVFVMNTSKRTATGTYQIKADTSYGSYEKSTGTSSFTIK